MVPSGAERIMTCLLRVLTPSSLVEQSAAMKELHCAIEQLQRERDEAKLACAVAERSESATRTSAEVVITRHGGAVRGSLRAGRRRRCPGSAKPSHSPNGKLNLAGWPWK